jgi:hypothetical protein
MASAKMNAKIMASSMRDDADGFRPTARTAPYPTQPITTAGPIELRIMIKMMVVFLINVP